MNTKMAIPMFFIVGIVIGTITFIVGPGVAPIDQRPTVSNEAAAPTTEKAVTPSEEPLVYSYEASYTALTRGQMITQSDAIFVGQVRDISSAQWNQDNGEYFEDHKTFQILYHDIEVHVVRSIVDSLNLDDVVTVTVLGNSPAGSIDSGPEIRSDPEHSLQTGDQYVFFVVKRHMGWKNDPTGPEETRLILRFITAPSISYLKKVDSGTSTNDTLDDETLFVAEDSSEQPLSIADILRLRESPEPTPTIIATDNQ
ncbi:MAG: hypothetical protein AAGF95_23130 [Chloroflexota bacterium]